MNAMADQFAAHDVGSIFLYTHEAHSGEYYPHLTTMGQKFQHARALRDRLGVTRPILVDALDGACHRAYGSMPKISWIFTASGTPIYKSDWTDAQSLQNALEYFLGAVTRRREGQRLAPFRVERLDFRHKDQDAFYRCLERNGPKAVQEYRRVYG